MKNKTGDLELQCIEYALNYKHQLLEQKIRNVRLWPGIEWPSFRKGWIEWKPSLFGKIFQITLTPVTVLLLITLAPLMSFTDVIQRWQFKRQFRKEQLEIEAAISKPYTRTEPKSIVSLWRFYGINESFGFQQQLHLVEKWIEILYGSNTLNQYDLKSRSDSISRKNYEANTPYYKGEDAPHFFFKPVVDTLVREIANELPPYG